MRGKLIGMSRLISRIALSVVVFPAALLMDLILFLLLNRYTQWESDYAVFISNLATAAVIDAWWFLLWRTAVKWTPRRVRTTMFAFGLSVLGGGMIGWGVRHVITQEEVATFTGTMSAALLWCGVSVVLWRETPAERGERLRRAGGADTLVCPACGYNLTGLREARCPECGASFTLNELLAGQPSRAPAEIEAI